MNLGTFKESLARDEPPEHAGELLRALWHEAKGDWHRAHEIAQTHEDAAGAWVHAYLHRKEGDTANAGYWYRRAGRSPQTGGGTEAEWETIVTEFLRARSES